MHETVKEREEMRSRDLRRVVEMVDVEGFSSSVVPVCPLQAVMVSLGCFQRIKGNACW